MFQYCLYKIDEKPYCCWELDVKKRNIEFLNKIDWEYFIFQSELFGKELDGENKQKAALAIRNIYHHAMETFFLLVCSTLQAPYCVYAWMFHAKTGDIRNVIRKLTKSDNSLFTNFRLEEKDWQSLSSMIHFINVSAEYKIPNQKELAKQFTRLWSSLSERFLDDYSIKEYNAIKHGLRTSIGGFTVNIGPKGTLNVPERHNEWRSLGSSEFGSSFYVIEQLINASIKDNPNYQSTRYHLNWNPKLLVDVIKLIAISINNFVNFLKFINGVEPEKTPYFIPETDELFNNYWEYTHSLSQMKFDIDIKPEQIQPFGSQEIISFFEKQNQ